MAHKDERDTENVVEARLTTIAERLTTIAERMTSITQLMLTFFEPGDPDQWPCIENIDNSLRRTAEALEVYAGGVGASHRLTAIESQMRIMNLGMEAILDTLDIPSEDIPAQEMPA